MVLHLGARHRQAQETLRVPGLLPIPHTASATRQTIEQSLRVAVAGSMTGHHSGCFFDKLLGVVGGTQGIHVFGGVRFNEDLLFFIFKIQSPISGKACPLSSTRRIVPLRRARSGVRWLCRIKGEHG